MATPVSSFPLVQFAPGKLLETSITTKDFFMRPVIETDATNYYNCLYANPQAMADTTEKVETLDWVVRRVSLWCSRWQKGDPFSAFCITNKADGSFVGHGILGHSQEPGIAELAILTIPQYCKPENQGQIGEALLAYGKKLVGTPLEDIPFKIVEVTCRVGQVAKQKLISSFAGAPVAREWRHGAERYVFRLDLTKSEQNRGDRMD